MSGSLGGGRKEEGEVGREGCEEGEAGTGERRWEMGEG